MTKSAGRINPLRCGDRDWEEGGGEEVWVPSQPINKWLLLIKVAVGTSWEGTVWPLSQVGG